MLPEKQGKNRGKGKPPVEHRFQPGESGNPGGRPKDTIKSLARSRSPEAFEKVVALMKKSRSERIQLQAAELILSYAWGKPAQVVEQTSFEVGYKELDNIPTSVLRQIVAGEEWKNGSR